jgi:hypothetical protein
MLGVLAHKIKVEGVSPCPGVSTGLGPAQDAGRNKLALWIPGGAQSGSFDHTFATAAIAVLGPAINLRAATFWRFFMRRGRPSARLLCAWRRPNGGNQS